MISHSKLVLLEEADMKREMERKEQERKKSQKVEFVAGGAQPGTVAPALKMSMQIPGTNFLFFFFQ